MNALKSNDCDECSAGAIMWAEVERLRAVLRAVREFALLGDDGAILAACDGALGPTAAKPTDGT